MLKSFIALALLVAANTFKVIQDLNEEGKTILLVEQNGKKVLKLTNVSMYWSRKKRLFLGTAKDILE